MPTAAADFSDAVIFVCLPLSSSSSGLADGGVGSAAGFGDDLSGPVALVPSVERGDDAVSGLVLSSAFSGCWIGLGMLILGAGGSSESGSGSSRVLGLASPVMRAAGLRELRPFVGVLTLSSRMAMAGCETGSTPGGPGTGRMS